MLEAAHGPPLRIELEGAFYHVMARGNARQDIFLTMLTAKRLSTSWAGLPSASIGRIGHGF